jgi:hypothetical protein
MRQLVLIAMITLFAVGTAAAQSCESQAVSAAGRSLHGAAKTSFIKKCKRDACAGKAVSEGGKPLHGAAKNSFMAKCMKTA